MEGFASELHNGKYSDILNYYKTKTYHSNGLIYRGVETSGTYNIIDPKKSTRVSSNTFNYYNQIMSNDPSWSKFPNRSRSIICTTNYKKSQFFGESYVVFPVNGSVIGIASAQDIWGSFKHLPKGKSDDDGLLSSFFKQINSMFNVIADREYEQNHPVKSKLLNFLEIAGIVDKKEAQFDKDLTVFKKALKGLDDYIKNVDSDLIFGWGYDSLFKKLYKGDMYKTLVELLDPIKNGMTTTKVGQKLPNENLELWTEGKSLMMRTDYFWDAHKEGSLYP